jgi:hypothetical protein
MSFNHNRASPQEAHTPLRVLLYPNIRESKAHSPRPEYAISSHQRRDPENVFSASSHSLSPCQVSPFPSPQIPAVEEASLKPQTKTDTRAKTRTIITSARIRTQLKKTWEAPCRISKQRPSDRSRRLITPAKSTYAMITRSRGPP